MALGELPKFQQEVSPALVGLGLAGFIGLHYLFSRFIRSRIRYVKPKEMSSSDGEQRVKIRNNLCGGPSELDETPSGSLRSKDS